MLDKDFDEIQAKAEDLDEADDWGPSGEAEPASDIGWKRFNLTFFMFLGRFWRFSQGTADSNTQLFNQVITRWFYYHVIA